jgi:hypothetical protein
MVNELALVLSALGLGGLLGAFAKAVLDKQQLKFTKVFEFKEARYKAIVIMMWAALNLDGRQMQKLKAVRPDIASPEALDGELELEYYNAMLYASDDVLKHLALFNEHRTIDNWRGTLGISSAAPLIAAPWATPAAGPGRRTCPAPAASAIHSLTDLRRHSDGRQQYGLERPNGRTPHPSRRR